VTDRVFYLNHAGAVGVSLEEVLEGRLVAPNGRIMAVTHPWREVDDEDLPLTEIQAASLEAFETELAAFQEKWEAGRVSESDWEKWVSGVVDPINARVDNNPMGWA
jgi:hypothetical protein